MDGEYLRTKTVALEATNACVSKTQESETRTPLCSKSETQPMASEPDYEAIAKRLFPTAGTTWIDKTLEALHSNPAALAEFAKGTTYVDSTVYLRAAGPDGDKGFKFELESQAMKGIAEMLAGYFIEHGGKNYVEQKIRIGGADIGPLVFTMQRENGKTPHELKVEAEQQLAALQKSHDRLLDFSSDFKSDYLCIGWYDEMISTAKALSAKSKERRK